MARKKISAKEFVEQATGLRLSAHEKLCAERMKNIQDSIKELSKEVKSLRTEVSKGKGAISVLVFLGTLIVGLVGFFKWNG
jgi:Flp pilus assembly protein TadB